MKELALSCKAEPLVALRRERNSPGSAGAVSLRWRFAKLPRQCRCRFPSVAFCGAYQVCRCYGADRAYCLFWGNFILFSFVSGEL